MMLEFEFIVVADELEGATGDSMFPTVIVPFIVTPGSPSAS
jgi:hypothetical protein